MQSKISSKWFVFVVSVAGIIFFAIVIFFLVHDLPVFGSFSKITLVGEQANSFSSQTGLGLPFRLKIPSINVDSAIEQVGIAPDGSMDVPKGPDDAAWFNLGPRPGEIGSSVIDGHSGYKNNRPAVFDKLYKLKKGDKIYVEDDKGNITTFVVREFKTYNPKADAKMVFSSNDGGSHLNLITCSGSWNKVERTHSDRLVVFADKEVQ